MVILFRSTVGNTKIMKTEYVLSQWKDSNPTGKDPCQSSPNIVKPFFKDNIITEHTDIWNIYVKYSYSVIVSCT